MPHEAAAAGDDNSEESTFRFLITTDNHLGYMERDPRRGDDSFVTFEEALAIGRLKYDCDAVLLGGDLFHENKPSLSCLTRTLALFRKYVMGSKPIGFSLVSDPATTFPTHPAPIANFQDPNLNIALPVFMVHGNHDDPVGGVSSIDVLATAGLVNYFGHTNDVDDIVVRPVLLKKGTTCVAIYGLGNVRDERLHRCFTLGKVRFAKPRANADRWFNILILHQNRGCRGGPNAKGGINEDMLLGFGFDLVIWGNEHEQRMMPMAVDGALEVIQPGSTILTSLGAAESNPKQCGVLEVCGTAYRLTPHTLHSVRPVVRRTVELWRQQGLPKTADAVEEYLRHVIEEMLVEAEDRIRRIPDNVLAVHPHVKFPLMRIAVDFCDPQGGVNFPQPNLNRFGQQYIDVIVNPNDVLKATKPKAAAREAALRSNDPNARDLDGVLAPALDDRGDGAGGSHVTTDDIRTKIAQVFSANAKDACVLLSEPEVSHAVHSFVEKGERDAIFETVETLLQACQRNIWKSVRDDVNGAGVSRAGISELAVQHKQERNKLYFERHDREAAAVDDIALLPPPPSHEPVDALLAGAPRSIQDLASRSAFALAHVPLGAPLPSSRSFGALMQGAEDDLPAAGIAPAAVAPTSTVVPADGSKAPKKSAVAVTNAIVVDEDEDAPVPPKSSPASKAPAAAPASAPPQKKTRTRAAAKTTAPEQRKPEQPRPAAPQLATTAVNPTAALMARWGAGGGPS